MRPISQTVELADELTRSLDSGFDVLVHLQSLADQIQDVVPDCTGLSIAWSEHGVAFTLVASKEEIAVLDAVQYLAGGPCVDALATGESIEWSAADPTDEQTWQTFAQATAAPGVKSTLTMPLLHFGAVMGTANIYAASDNAFEGHYEAVGQILGGSVTGIVRNADLSFTTRGDAERSMAAMHARDTINTAVGVMTSALGLEPEAAEHRLREVATRADLTVDKAAEVVIRLFG